MNLHLKRCEVQLLAGNAVIHGVLEGMPNETTKNTKMSEGGPKEILTAATQFVEAQAALKGFFPSLSDEEIPKLAGAFVEAGAKTAINPTGRGLFVRLPTGSKGQVPLRSAVEEVLRKSKTGMTVRDVLSAVQARGFALVSGTPNPVESIRQVLTANEEVFRKRQPAGGKKEATFTIRSASVYSKRKKAKKMAATKPDAKEALFKFIETNFTDGFIVQDVAKKLGKTGKQLVPAINALAREKRIRRYGERKGIEGNMVAFWRVVPKDGKASPK